MKHMCKLYIFLADYIDLFELYVMPTYMTYMYINALVKLREESQAFQ